MIDSHAHLDSERYDDDREAMLQRARAAGVEAILSIGIGDGPDTMHRAADLSEQYGGREDVPKIYASAGIHPHEAKLATPDALAMLEVLTRHKNVIAVGEIGLDYFYDNSPREEQKAAFRQQMEIAAAAKLPILIHCRPSADSTNAWDDTLAMLEQDWASHALGGVLHCFTGTAEHARRALDIGFLLSFAGNITFPKAAELREVAKHVPTDSFLIETDAPFLAPVPNRGKRNEPAWVVAVAAQLAAVRGVAADDVAAITTENFRQFFGATRALA
jgi:TatD DNase family protein